MKSLFIITGGSDAGLLDIIGGNNNNPLGNIQRNPLRPLLSNNGDENNNRDLSSNINLFPVMNTGGNRPSSNGNAYENYRNSNFRQPNSAYNRPTNGNQFNGQNTKEQLENVLERLQDLNRRKEQKEEEEKRKQNGGSDQNEPDDNDSQTGPEHNNTIPRPEFNNYDVNKNGWKEMNKRKILFQVLPVIPENEITRNHDTVYYINGEY